MALGPTQTFISQVLPPPYCYALILSEENNFSASIHAAKKALEQKASKSRQAAAYLLIGRCYAALEEFTFAEGSYRESLALTPEPWVYILLGSVLDKQERGEEALQCLHDALQLDQSYDEAHYNLGVYYLTNKIHQLAEYHLREAIKSDSDYALAHQKLGYLLLESQKYSEAKEHLSRAWGLEPSNKAIGVALAECLRLISQLN